MVRPPQMRVKETLAIVNDDCHKSFYSTVYFNPLNTNRLTTLMGLNKPVPLTSTIHRFPKKFPPWK